MPDDWEDLDRVNRDIGCREFSRGAHDLFARSRLFNGGYFLLAVTISLLVFLMTWVGTIHLDDSRPRS